MSTIFIDKRGSLLCKKNDNLLVKLPNEPDIELLINTVGRIIIYNGCSMSADALTLLLEKNIPLSVIGSHKFAGYLNPANQKNTPLRYKQYELIKNEKKCLEIYKEILDVKAYNLYRFLTKYLHYRDEHQYDSKLKQIDVMRKGFKSKDSLETLLGYEGAIAKTYFEIYGQLFPNDYQFNIRSRRPPKDPPNALLSFGYTILLSEVTQEIQGLGLDQNLGFIHKMDYSRPSLALDILEEFRFVIDSLVLGLFNKNQITIDHFEPENNGIYLNKEGRTKFFTAYEEKMRTQQLIYGIKRDYREIIRQQALFIKKFIDEGIPYTGYKYNAA